MKKDEISQQNNYLLEQNDFFIKKTAGKFIINSIISMVFLYIGSLVDTLLVGKFLGENGLSAMSLVSPVYLVYYTVGAVIGIGASIKASRVLGIGDTDAYRKTFTIGTIIMACAVVVMTFLGYAFINPITKALCCGMTDGPFELTKNYLLFYIPGGGLTLLAYIPLYFLKTEGKPKYSSRLFTMSAIMNVVLSWLFMSPVFNMGIGGAALATSISMGSVAVVGFIVMFIGKTELRFDLRCFDKSAIKEMLVAGIPNGMSNLLESARIYMINWLLIFIGASAILPCYTVVRNVNEVLNSVIIGISSALIPLIGVFFGEGNYVDERSVMKRSMKLGIIVTAVLTIVVLCIPEPIMGIFGVSDSIIIEEGKWALPLSCAALTFAYANTLYTSYLTAIHHEMLATIMVVLRLFAMLAVFSFVLAFTIGSKGIWISLSLTEIATYLAFCVFRIVIRKKNPSIDTYFLDTSKENGEDINFSVQNDVAKITEASEKISAFCEEHDIDMKKSMRVSLAIEEILTFLTAHCLTEDKLNYVAVRVAKLDENVAIRFRYVGQIYDPMDFYNQNQADESLQEELLGLKMVTKSAINIKFQQTLGTNNLLLVF